MDSSLAWFAGVRTLVIDAYGTLVTTGNHLDLPAAIRPVLNRALRPGSPPIDWPEIYLPYDELFKRRDYCGELTPRQLWNAFLDHLGQDQRFAVSRGPLVAQLHVAEAELYEYTDWIPGALDFLDWAASEAGLRLVLCTNATQSGWATLHRLGVVRCFESRYLAASCLLGRHKNPGNVEASLFRAVADLPDVDPATALVIEDEGQYCGIARQLGFHAALVHWYRGQPANGDAADVIVPSLRDLQTLLTPPSR